MVCIQLLTMGAQMNRKIQIYKPSPKMRYVYNESCKGKYRLLTGSVRSGKSFTTDDIAIREISELPDCNVLISGYSITSVARNVIAEWKKKILPPNVNVDDIFVLSRDDKDEFLLINWRGLKGKKFYIRGAGKENDYKQIQGATFGYWLADELTRHQRSFFDMAVSRLSLSYSRAIWTTNPDSPLHWVKTDIIDKLGLRENDLYQVFSFELTDNPSLTKEYIDGLKNIFTGVFYKRYILGMWVLAEGSIYDFWDEDLHTLDTSDRTALYHVVGCDYGTADPMVYGLFGVNPGYEKGKIWLADEWYYDSRVSMRTKSDQEYSACLKNWLAEKDIWPHKIFIPSDALAFKTELRNSGFYNITDVDMGPGSVLNGIRTQGTMLKHGDYLIDKCCKNTIRDYAGYVWDDKARINNGVEKPLHANSHTKDMERTLLYTIFGSEGIDYDRFCQM
jgi:PBSX family phage terminase large subunit